MAYYGVEPWGEERADLRMGILASTMANLWSSKTSRPSKPKDFMPDFGAHEKQSVAVMQHRLRVYAAAAGIPIIDNTKKTGI